jgi:uncharacterized membrane protein required for colicin V production
MAYGFYYGYSRGIIGTVFTLAGYILGAVFAFKAMPITTSILENIFNTTTPMMSAAGFLVNIIIVMFVLRLFSNGVEGILNAVYLGVINSILGGALMALIAALIFSVLIWFGVKASFIRQEVLNNSITYNAFLYKLPGKARGVIVRLKPYLTEAWGESMEWMNRLEDVEVPQDENQPRIYELPDDGAAIEDEPEESEPRSRTSETGIE